MASSVFKSSGFLILGFLLLFLGNANAQLSNIFYSITCPNLFSIVKSTVGSALSNEARMGASILRLFFLDCFVNGCDGSILLDDTDNFTGEKNADPNRNSARGFEVIDDIKTAVENACPLIVSCADILAIAARDSVEFLGGPSWSVQLGRRDALTANKDKANDDIPSPSSNINQLMTRFHAVGLSNTDLVALSGAHTIGQARCINFRDRIYNDTNIDSLFAQKMKETCPSAPGSEDENLATLDIQTPNLFDNSYFRNLIQNKGLLHSDQLLLSNAVTGSLVRRYSTSQAAFHSHFVRAMIRMGQIRALTGLKGEIRKNCRMVN